MSEIGSPHTHHDAILVPGISGGNPAFAISGPHGLDDTQHPSLKKARTTAGSER